MTTLFWSFKGQSVTFYSQYFKVKNMKNIKRKDKGKMMLRRRRRRLRKTQNA
jgi:hypothetical protein